MVRDRGLRSRPGSPGGGRARPRPLRRRPDRPARLARLAPACSLLSPPADIAERPLLPSNPACLMRPSAAAPSPNTHAVSSFVRLPIETIARPPHNTLTWRQGQTRREAGTQSHRSQRAALRRDETAGLSALAGKPTAVIQLRSARTCADIRHFAALTVSQHPSGVERCQVQTSTIRRAHTSWPCASVSRCSSGATWRAPATGDTDRRSPARPRPPMLPASHTALPRRRGARAGTR